MLSFQLMHSEAVISYFIILLRRALYISNGSCFFLPYHTLSFGRAHISKQGNVLRMYYCIPRSAIHIEFKFLVLNAAYARMKDRIVYFSFCIFHVFSCFLPNLYYRMYFSCTF